LARIGFGAYLDPPGSGRNYRIHQDPVGTIGSTRIR
jgi:hypothetical protein